MKLQVIQGSQEWLNLRFNKVGASDAGPCMGVGYDTPFTLWEKKITRVVIEETAPMRKGKMMEPHIRQRLEKRFGMALESPVYQHDSIPYMIASLDAYNEAEGFLAEIKCGSATYTNATLGIIPPHYYAQCQHQLEVMSLDKMLYVCSNGEHEIYMDVARDSKFIKKMLDAEAKFWDHLSNFTPPDLTDLDYTKKVDSEWLDTQNSWLAAQEESTKWDKLEKEARQKLIELSEGKNCKTDAIKLTKIIRAGSIQYDLIPEIKSINFDKFRKDPITTYRITKNK